MSNQYLEKYGRKIITKEKMRLHCQRPGKVDENGKIIYFTEQAHKKETDINLIIKKYDKTGLINHISQFEHTYGDMTGLDYKQMQDLIISAKNQFNMLPAEIKKRFENDPSKLLEFMENSGNRNEAIELGLINKDWTELTDGLGEHVKAGENLTKEEEEKSKQKQTKFEEIQKKP